RADRRRAPGTPLARPRPDRRRLPDRRLRRRGQPARDVRLAPVPLGFPSALLRLALHPAARLRPGRHQRARDPVALRPRSGVLPRLPRRRALLHAGDLRAPGRATRNRPAPEARFLPRRVPARPGQPRPGGRTRLGCLRRARRTTRHPADDAHEFTSVRRVHARPRTPARIVLGGRRDRPARASRRPPVRRGRAHGHHGAPPRLRGGPRTLPRARPPRRACLPRRERRAREVHGVVVHLPADLSGEPLVLRPPRLPARGREDAVPRARHPRRPRELLPHLRPLGAEPRSQPRSARAPHRRVGLPALPSVSLGLGALLPNGYAAVLPDRAPEAGRASLVERRPERAQRLTSASTRRASSRSAVAALPSRDAHTP